MIVPVIFVARDIRTWIIKYYFSRKYILSGKHFENFAPTAAAYASQFLQSFLHPRALRLRMEDSFAEDGNCTPGRVADFLSVERTSLENFWEKRDVVARKFGYDDWLTGHKSAFTKPVPDTATALTDAPFWREFLPLFDKYYAHGARSFSEAEVQADMRAITEIGERLPVSIATGYDGATTATLGLHPKVSISNKGVFLADQP
jgi:hypothetical protein